MQTRMNGIRAGGALLLMCALSATCRGSDRDALLRIVQEQCVPHWQLLQDPSPCQRIIGSDFAVLKDRKGGAHFLLIATARVRGMEDPAVLGADAPGYFAAAWEARERLASVTGAPVADDAAGLAINSAIARGQDQLHIHIECLRPRLRALLRADAGRIGERWARLPGAREPWLARRVPSLAAESPFRLLADGVPAARAHMERFTLVAAHVSYPDGPGFVLLAGPTGAGPAALFPHGGLVPPGEMMLDSTCAGAVDQVQLPSSPPPPPPPSSQPDPSLIPKSGPPRSGLGSGGG